MNTVFKNVFENIINALFFIPMAISFYCIVFSLLIFWIVDTTYQKIRKLFGYKYNKKFLYIF